MSASETKNWKDLYHAALLETNPDKFNERLLEAQETIENKLSQIRENPSDRDELHALLDALGNLQTLGRNKK